MYITIKPGVVKKEVTETTVYSPVSAPSFNAYVGEGKIFRVEQPVQEYIKADSDSQGNVHIEEQRVQKIKFRQRFAMARDSIMGIFSIRGGISLNQEQEINKGISEYNKTKDQYAIALSTRSSRVVKESLHNVTAGGLEQRL